MNKNQKWFWIAVFAMVLIAPGSMIMRYTVLEIDPYLLNFLRSIIVFLVCFPIIRREMSRIRGEALKVLLSTSLVMSVSATTYILAILYSSASYVSILLLLTPIIFMFYSTKAFGEKINRRVAAGIILALTGAMVITLLPIAIEQGGKFIFYQLATILALASSLTYPLTTIEMRKLDTEYKISFFAISGFVSLVVAFASILLWLATGATTPHNLSWQAIAGVVYAGLVISVFARALSLWSYERIGSASTSAVTYVESLLSVILPVIFLRELLSLPMIFGGILIMFGVFVVQYSKSLHHKHHHTHRIR